MPSTVDPDTAPGAPDAAGGSDPLEALRRELEAIDQVPVADRVARFRRVNDALAHELAQLDEV